VRSDVRRRVAITATTTNACSARQRR
jgi:hypothetical protein